ncbi:unnamed protein product [Blepharisma stoltei]|uniref:Uncharacterized protein n=1 Tax=Blepharisma stoltei TaxID=1481888 RepID=A0AAU9KDX1_9CILI|nr:unnamed protein product [Blepharisma stoltei]
MVDQQRCWPKIDHYIGILGDRYTGKTSIIKSILKQGCTDHFNTYFGLAFILKTQPQGLEKPVKFLFFDPEEGGTLRLLNPKLIEKMSLTIVAYDVMSRESFDHIDFWVNSVKNQIASKLVLVIGNKIDMKVKNRAVKYEEAQEKCLKLNCFYIELSAKTTLHIHAMLSSIICLSKTDAKKRLPN